MIEPGADRFVLGFAFYPHPQLGLAVTLIRKHPDRGPPVVRGKLNGLGGALEMNENMRTAMCREFREESGVYIPDGRWNHFAILHGSWGAVYCFRTMLDRREFEDLMIGDMSMTDEPVGVYNAVHLPDGLAPRVDWLVPMARDLSVYGPVRVRLE